MKERMCELVIPCYSVFPYITQNTGFQKELYNFESLYKFIQRTCTLVCSRTSRVSLG
jgi:hypothetical protein